MANFATSSQMTDSSNTVLEQKGYVEDNADAIRQVVGTGADGALTISSGAITPVVAVNTVDTESSATTDDLSNIIATNFPDGFIVALKSLDAGRVVTVKHEAGGSGQISLLGGEDRELSTDTILTIRSDGANWVEEEANVNIEYVRERLNAAPGNNVLDNPDFGTNQYGLDATGITMSSASVYVIDRWVAQHFGSNLPTVSLESGNVLRMEMVGSDTSAYRFFQKVENYEDFAGKQVTLSAPVTTNIAGVTVAIEAGTRIKSSPHTGSGLEEMLELTITVPSSPSELKVFWGCVEAGITVGAGDFFECGEIKLEVGPIATEFIPPNPSEDLARCKPYYQRVPLQGKCGYCVNSTSVRLGGNITEMRGTPASSSPTTISIRTSSSPTTNIDASSPTVTANVDGDSVQFLVDGFTGLTAGDVALGVANDQYIELDANL